MGAPTGHERETRSAVPSSALERPGRRPRGVAGATRAGEIFHWRGPSPYHFVRVPEEQVEALRAVAREVTYGWGMVPVELTLGTTVWTTSLWPKDGGYLVPIKDRVREAEGVDEGDVVTVRVSVRPRRR